MDMTERDYAERLDRVKNGTADDEDRRLVKHYEREGFEVPESNSDGSWLFASDDGDGTERDKYDAMEFPALRAECGKRKLSAKGTQKELRIRLREHDAAQADKD